LDPAKLATPEAFQRDPQLVWEWYRERRERIRAAKPNAAHKAIVDLARRAREFLLVTQNVDDLHARAGLAAEKMVQIHGDIFVTRCVRCGLSTHEELEKLDGFKPSSLTSGGGEVAPVCGSCGALMRPGVVWFGEMLDPRKIDIVENYLGADACDLVLVIGTTALFGYISDWALRAHGRRGRLIEINPEETALSSFATQCIREPAAIALPKLMQRFLG
jgi:NAD-dependent deacetylase